MDKVMPGYLGKTVFVYLDDLSISSPSFDMHLSHLAMVADRLGNANLTINIKKSWFCCKNVQSTLDL